MKKILLLAIGFLMTMTASAQFEQGKYYCNGSLTGINLSYSGAEKLSLGVEAKGDIWWQTTGWHWSWQATATTKTWMTSSLLEWGAVTT